MSLPRVIISIVFNGYKHLQAKYTNLGYLNAFTYLAPNDRVIFVEGASKSTFCTSWCKELPHTYHNNGASLDGTRAFLQSLVLKHPNTFSLITNDGLWDGKVNMFNKALEQINYPCYLWEEDIDEFWAPDQRTYAESILDHLKGDTAAFMCNYYLTDDIVVRGEWGESTGHGYRRLWKYQPGMKFTSHEPPILSGCTKIVPPVLLPRFNHYSYYYEEDVKFKSLWYSNHENIYDNWKKIKDGSIKLPTKVYDLFGTTNIPSDWGNSIITYA